MIFQSYMSLMSYNTVWSWSVVLYKSEDESLTRYHINYVILWYRLRIRHPCDIAAPRCWTILCTNATGQHAVLSTIQNDDNYLNWGYLMLPERPGIDSQSVTVPCCAVQHTCRHRWWSLVESPTLSPHTSDVCLDTCLSGWESIGSRDGQQPAGSWKSRVISRATGGHTQRLWRSRGWTYCQLNDRCRLVAELPLTSLRIR